MAEATQIRREVTGAKILEAIQKDVGRVGYEMIEGLLDQVERTGGMVPQAVALSIKFTPAKDETPGTFACYAKLTSKGEAIVKAVRMNEGAKVGQQLSMFLGED